MKIYKILGKKGRVTIPYELRKAVGFSSNDVISFEQLGSQSVIIRKEQISEGDDEKSPSTRKLTKMLDALSVPEQRTALWYLNRKFANTTERANAN